MSAMEPHPRGVVLAVRAQPGARSNGIVGVHEGALKVAVTQVAEKGKANKAIIALLAKQLGVARSRIELLGGETNRNKRFLIRDATAAQVQSRLSLG